MMIKKWICFLVVCVSLFGLLQMKGEANNYPPAPVDSDGDGLSDADELSDSGVSPDTDGYITNPNNPDTDGDGINDGDEHTWGTDPLDSDSDGDLLPDGWEVLNGFNPLNNADGLADADSDGLSNGEEYERQTDLYTATPSGVLVVMPDANQYQANEPDLSWTDLP